MNARNTVAALAALVALGGLVGCSDDGGAGGKTTCGQFQPMTVAQREKVVTKMMQDHGDLIAEIEVRALAIQVDFFCVSVAADAAIEGVYAVG